MDKENKNNEEHKEKEEHVHTSSSDKEGKKDSKKLEEEIKKDTTPKKEIAQKTGKKEDKRPIIERTYTIPLRKSFEKVPRYKKANKAIKTIKEFLVKHMKIYDRDLKNIRLDKTVNEFIWLRGIRKPAIKIKVKASKIIEGDKTIVRVELVDVPEKLKYRKIKQDNILKRLEDKGKKKPAKKTSEEVKKPEEIKSEEEVKDEKEKKAATIEGTEKMEKQAAKAMKHQTKGQSKDREPKIKRVALKK